MAVAAAPLKALTVSQPWASLIARGIKTLEVRSWRTEYRGPLVIHASKNTPGQRADDLAWAKRRYPGDYPLGCVVAIADLVDCRRPRKPSDGEQSLYAALGEELTPDDWLWCLTNIRPCVPVKCSGVLRVWDIDPALVQILSGEPTAPSAGSAEKPAPQKEHKDKAWRLWLEKASDAEDAAAAEAILRQGLAHMPECGPLAAGLASFLEERGRLDEAESMFRRAVELSPWDSHCASLFGNFLVDARHAYGEAEQVFRAAVAGDRYNPILLKDYANLVGKLPGRLEEARQMYEKAILMALGERYVAAADDAVEFYANQLKNLARAKHLRELTIECCELTPALRARELMKLARFLMKYRRQSKAALEIIRGELEAEPENDGLKKGLGIMLILVKRDCQAAAKLFRQVYERDPADYVTAVNLVGALMASGKTAEASKRATSALNLVRGRARKQEAAELALYRALLAHQEGKAPSAALQQLSELLAEGFKRKDSLAEPLVEQATRQMERSEQTLYRGLAAQLAAREARADAEARPQSGQAAPASAGD